MFEYINDNLEKIKNPNDVMMIKTIRGDVKNYLGAYLKSGELIRLTKSKGFMAYPFDPFYWLSSQVVGKWYLQNFEEISDHVAINKNYLEGFVYSDSLERKKRYDLFVNLSGGISVRIAQPDKKYFDKTLLPEMKQKFGDKIEKSENGTTIE